jgi:hypothetical protein
MIRISRHAIALLSGAFELAALARSRWSVRHGAR